MTFYSVNYKLLADVHGAICELCNKNVHVFSYGDVTLLIGGKKALNWHEIMCCLHRLSLYISGKNMRM